jgi:non-ribosomal peptide synthetase component F
VNALAALKMGAAYIPLDSAWPTERLRFVVEDS